MRNKSKRSTLKLQVTTVTSRTCNITHQNRPKIPTKNLRSSLPNTTVSYMKKAEPKMDLLLKSEYFFMSSKKSKNLKNLIPSFLIFFLIIFPGKFFFIFYPRVKRFEN